MKEKLFSWIDKVQCEVLFTLKLFFPKFLSHAQFLQFFYSSFSFFLNIMLSLVVFASFFYYI